MSDIEQRPVSRDFFLLQPENQRKYFVVEQQIQARDALQSTRTPPSSSGSTIGLPTLEKDFQQRLIKLLQDNEFWVCEFRKARIMKGGVDVYRTPFGADGVGFPDLVAVKPPRLLFIECKSDKGKASPEQMEWLLKLSGCPVEVYCWHPAQWLDGTIERTLK